MADEQFLNPQERISRELEREFHTDVPPGENVDATAPRTEAMGLTADALKDLRDTGLTPAVLLGWSSGSALGAASSLLRDSSCPGVTSMHAITRWASFES